MSRRLLGSALKKSLGRKIIKIVSKKREQKKSYLISKAINSTCNARFIHFINGLSSDKKLLSNKQQFGLNSIHKQFHLVLFFNYTCDHFFCSQNVLF